MQELILKVGGEWTNSEEEPWAIYNEAKSNKRDVDKDKIKQVEG